MGDDSSILVGDQVGNEDEQNQSICSCRESSNEAEIEPVENSTSASIWDTEHATTNEEVMTCLQESDEEEENEFTWNGN